MSSAIPAGKSECDRKMLAELNTLVPKGRREKVDRLLVRNIIGLKHRLGMGVWSNQVANELHKPVRRQFDKRSVFAKQAVAVLGGGGGAMALGLALFMPKKGLALLPPPPPPPMHLSECPKVFGKMSQSCPRCPQNGFNLKI